MGCIDNLYARGQPTDTEAAGKMINDTVKGSTRSLRGGAMMASGRKETCMEKDATLVPTAHGMKGCTGERADYSELVDFLFKDCLDQVHKDNWHRDDRPWRGAYSDTCQAVMIATSCTSKWNYCDAGLLPRNAPSCRYSPPLLPIFSWNSLEQAWSTLWSRENVLHRRTNVRGRLG